MAKKRRSRLRSDANLGGEQAEADPLLQFVFYESADYHAIESHMDARCFIIGRTGAGKSAAFQYLQESKPGKVVRITPEDLSLPYIVDLGIVRYLDSLDVHLDLFFVALWKHVLLVELIRHRYNVDTPVAKQNFLSNLRERVQRDSGKRAALDYLDEFGGSFWCETDERVREITETFRKQIEAEASFTLPHISSANVGGGTSLTTEARAQQADRFQRIVNQTQLARLNKMLTVLDEDILDSPQHYTYVVIDDLDRDWVDERLANDLIRCLFRAVLDLKQRVRNLKVLVALRTNIFQELDFGARTGGQEEKFRSLVLQMRWTKDDLEQMMTERVRYVSRQGEYPMNSLSELLPSSNNTRGYAFDYIVHRTLMRPRDAIAFLNECLAVADGKGYLTWTEITAAERAYSEKRLLALRDEWKPTYPDIQRVLRIFSQAPMPMTRDELANYLDEAMLLLSDPAFRGVLWMTDLSAAMWSSAGDPSWTDLYQPLIKMLYNIGFLGIRRPQDSAAVYSYDDTSLAESPASIQSAASFSIHATYQKALDIKEFFNRG